MIIIIIIKLILFLRKEEKTSGDALVTTSALTRHIRGHFLGKLMQIYSSYGSEERPPRGGREGGTSRGRRAE